MYNLLVTAEEGAWDRSRNKLARSRYLEYTLKEICERFASLSESNRTQVMSFPALFAYETVCASPARLGRITKIRESGSEIRFEFKIESGLNPLSLKQLTSLLDDLDIDEWEMNRTHWAIKDVDLLETLVRAQILDAKELFGNRDGWQPTSTAQAGLGACEGSSTHPLFAIARAPSSPSQSEVRTR